ncbi:MAG: ATPase domain-containing protein [Candidatus Bathyarchaeia archaeon]
MTGIKKVLTGIGCIDNNLDGGISPETITLIYGEPETGKSTLAIQCAFNCAMQELKTLYVDCDNTFSSKRLCQISAGKFDEIADRIILIKPVDFKEQTAVIDRIGDYVTKNVGLIVVDTMNSLYGAKVAESSSKAKAFSVNRELNRQMALLAQVAKIQKIPIIITSQVRSMFSDPSGNVKPAANRVLTFWADNIISLKPTETKTIKATIEKNHAKMVHVTCYVQIGERGISEAEFRE